MKEIKQLQKVEIKISVKTSKNQIKQKQKMNIDGKNNQNIKKIIK